MNRIVLQFVIALGLHAFAVAQNGSLSVSGVHQFVAVNGTSTLAPSPHLTVEAWCKFGGTVPGASHYTLFRYPGQSPAYLMRLINGGASAEFYAYVNGGLVSISAPVPTTVGTWRHLAGVYDGTAVRLYFDGVQVASQAVVGTAVSFTGDMRIGDGASNESSTFNGLIDEFRVWNYARSASQIVATMPVSLGPEPGLVSYWKFSGNYLDSVGPHHGTPMAGISLSAENAPVAAAILSAPQAVGVGGPCVWTLNATIPGDVYYFDLTLGGSSPGVPVGPGFTIPLNPPWLFTSFASSLPAGTFSNFIGTLTSTSAHPVLLIPDAPSLAGLTLTSSFVGLDPTLFTVKYVSTPKATAILATAPHIGSVSPTTVPDVGGTFSVIGSGFVSGAAVKLGGSPIPTTFVSATELSATAPAGPIGGRLVGVVNPTGSEAFLLEGLSYVATLKLGSVTPAAADAGAPIAVAGEGFVAGTTFTIGGVPAAATIGGATSAVVTVPVGVPCDAVFQASNPDGQTAVVPWNESPVVAYAFYAQSGAAGGGVFLLTGTFPSGASVSVGGQPATIVSATSSAIVAIAPPGVPGVTTAVVFSATGCSASAPFVYY